MSPAQAWANLYQHAIPVSYQVIIMFNSDFKAKPRTHPELFDVLLASSTRFVTALLAVV